MKGKAGVRIILRASVSESVDKLDELRSWLGRPPLRRPWLCRHGFHRWGFWDLQPGNRKMLEATCRRCGAVGTMPTTAFSRKVVEAPRG